jgi:hypothetical protein
LAEIKVPGDRGERIVATERSPRLRDILVFRWSACPRACLDQAYMVRGRLWLMSQIINCSRCSVRCAEPKGTGSPSHGPANHPLQADGERQVRG